MAKIRFYNYTGKATEKQKHVDHPAHYQGKNECIDVMLAMFGVEAVKHFCMCNTSTVSGRTRRTGRKISQRQNGMKASLLSLEGLTEMENKHCFLCSYSIPHFFKDGKVTLKSPHGGTEVHEIKLNFCPECGKPIHNKKDEKEKRQ